MTLGLQEGSWHQELDLRGGVGLVLVVGVDNHTCLTPANTCGHSAVPTDLARGGSWQA